MMLVSDIVNYIKNIKSNKSGRSVAFSICFIKFMQKLTAYLPKFYKCVEFGMFTESCFKLNWS